ncbi:MAG: hypothetical protein RLZZ540_546 [Bacteroidota bacterium]|jgi:hypothetical protein
MTYSREKLESFHNLDAAADRTEYNAIVQNLVNKVLAGETITSAEELFVCPIIKMLRNVNNELAYNVDDYQACKDSTFRNRYLLYRDDLNGHKPVLDYDGIIPIETKRKDIEYLNLEYRNWRAQIESKAIGQDLLAHISKETNEQLKELKKYCDRRLIGSNFRDYLEKSLTLHGKYIYLLVKEFFQELKTNEIIIPINGYDVLIDSFTYVHIMFRHYAKKIKQHQNKSYHFDQNIGYKIIPSVLQDILECYKNESISSSFNGYSLYLRINQKPYAIYLKPITRHLKGNIKKVYYRVQTFFPIKDVSELAKITNLKVHNSQCGIDFLIKNVT